MRLYAGFDLDNARVCENQADRLAFCYGDTPFSDRPMSDVTLIQALAQNQSLQLIRTDHAAQMQLLRFWADELATPRNADPKRLLRHGFKMYSQCDEDGIIQEIFRRIGPGDRRFVEFGVETGVQCNTVKLLVEGWRGLWIDGSPQNVGQIQRHFASFCTDGRLKAIQSFVTAENINALIQQGGISGEMDLLSVDIDYNDYWVWQAIEVVKPRVVVIEYNATLRPPFSGVVPYEPTRIWDQSNYFGASLEALVRLGRRKGYRLVGCNFSGVNAFFVHESCAGDHFLDPATAEEHYEPPRYFFGLLNGGHRAQPGPYVLV
jgi:hypothetical protein